VFVLVFRRKNRAFSAFSVYKVIFQKKVDEENKQESRKHVWFIISIIIWTDPLATIRSSPWRRPSFSAPTDQGLSFPLEKSTID
jgi:hypothetical protein